MTTVTTIKARPDFKTVLDQHGIQQSKLARAAGVGASTIQSMARPEFFGREAIVRPATAHKVASGFAQMTGKTQMEAYKLLFDEEE